ncbi:enoyl-CoA hydratase [Litorivita sp. NS0012-18]|uniref:enoyl-CoA hydratase n=1 Tax=Litorivita sp. NS0012-18 TaxID=3127655 RepID=UPI0031067B64
MPDALKKDLQDGLLILTLNRPEARNALNLELTEALRDAGHEAMYDPAVRAVMLIGSGGHFCVGGDVKAMNEGKGRDAPYGLRRHGLRDRMDISRALHEMPKPTIAVVEGSCAGAGLSMAMACDFRICAEDSKITTAFAKVGLSGDYGGTYFMTHILGAAKARELYLTSQLLSGSEAAAMGLFSRALPAGDVASAGLEMARALAAGPTGALGRIKRNIALAEQGGTLGECMDMEATHFWECTETADHKEAAAAFVGKRKPVFTGR